MELRRILDNLLDLWLFAPTDRRQASEFSGESIDIIFFNLPIERPNSLRDGCHIKACQTCTDVLKTFMVRPDIELALMMSKA